MKYLFSLLTPFFLLLSSCSHKTVDKEAPIINEIKAGEKFTIILPENHLENFIWKINDARNRSVIDYMNSVWHGNEKGVYFNFITIKPGTDTLHFTQYKMQDSIKTSKYIIKVVE